jgi:hypothetical protein
MKQIKNHLSLVPAFGIRIARQGNHINRKTVPRSRPAAQRLYRAQRISPSPFPFARLQAGDNS